MRRFEREVVNIDLIDEMMKLFDTVNIGLNDDDGIPYVVPVNFGYEIEGDYMNVYFHCAKEGHMVSLMKKDPRVALAFNKFNDFYDYTYKKHHHDYRSVMAKGIVTLTTYDEDSELFKKANDSLYLCTNRTVIPIESRKVIPPIYMGVIKCHLKDVFAKSEFPIRTKEDVPFLDVFKLEKDDTPFDLSDIIELRKRGF